MVELIKSVEQFKYLNKILDKTTIDLGLLYNTMWLFDFAVEVVAVVVFMAVAMVATVAMVAAVVVHVPHGVLLMTSSTQ